MLIQPKNIFMTAIYKVFKKQSIPEIKNLCSQEKYFRFNSPRTLMKKDWSMTLFPSGSSRLNLKEKLPPSSPFS